MAVTKWLLSKSQKEVVIKSTSDASGGSATFTLNGDLMTADQFIQGTPPSVTIRNITWTGLPDAVIQITRGGETISTLQANASSMLFFDGQTMSPNSRMDTSDITLTFTGQAECWIRLRKNAGYLSTIAPEQYGSYEDSLNPDLSAASLLVSSVL